MKTKIDTLSTAARFHMSTINRRWSNASLLVHRSFDGHIVSMRQAGSHWLRNMLASILSQMYGLPPLKHIQDDSIIGHPKSPPIYKHIPQIIHTHGCPHALTLKLPGVHFPKYLVLVRELRASLVSHYERFKGDYGNPEFGVFLRGDPQKKTFYSDIWTRVRFMNEWGRMLDRHPDHTMILRYEDLQQDTLGWLRKICEFYIIRGVTDEMFAQAIRDGNTEKMAAKPNPSVTTTVVRTGDRKPIAEYFTPENQAFFDLLVRRYLKYDFGYGYLAKPGAQLKQAGRGAEQPAAAQRAKALKIVYIGNGNQKFAGQRHFGYDTRMFNGLVRNGHCVYFFSDRDEVRQQSPLGLLKPVGRARANQKLLQVADNIRPDAIVFSHVDTIDPETFEEIRRRLPEVRIAQINVDPLFNPTNRRNVLSRGQSVDATFSTTGGPALSAFARDRSPCYFIPNFSDSSIDTGTAFADERPAFDIACFMNVNPKKPDDEADRLALVNGLVSAIPDLRACFGGFNGLPSVRGHAYIGGLAKSAMGLNLSKLYSGAPSSPESRYLYSSDRIAHILGNGCLAFIESNFGLHELYAPDETVFFNGLADLTDKVRYYRDHPADRQALAKKGWEKAHREFEVTIVMKYILERLFDKSLTQTYSWPVDAYYPVPLASVTASR